MKLTPLQKVVVGRRFAIGGLCIALTTAAAYFVLVNPDNPLTNFFSAPIEVRDARIVVGPYPKESDFQLLQKNGVTTVVSLLDAQLPYERVLLNRERSLAVKYGMVFENYPMGSVLSHRVGRDYDKEAALAAMAVRHARGRVYLHCYLGMHRVKAVEDLLARPSATSAEYLASHGERTPDELLLDQAQSLYDSRDYRAALRSLFNISQKSEASKLLQAWATYHLNDIQFAANDFKEVLKENPESVGAALGLGYCMLRQDQLGVAATDFARVLIAEPKNEGALTGMGLTRYRQGRAIDAAHYLRQALAINPNDGDAKAALARIPN